MEEIYRSGSAFSDSTVDSPVATAKFGKQLKKAFKLGKRKKKDKSSKSDKTKAEPASAPSADKFTDDVEPAGYRFCREDAQKESSYDRWEAEKSGAFRGTAKDMIDRL